jgi:hypothetical protein
MSSKVEYTSTDRNTKTGRAMREIFQCVSDSGANPLTVKQIAEAVAPKLPDTLLKTIERCCYDLVIATNSPFLRDNEGRVTLKEGSSLPTKLKHERKRRHRKDGPFQFIRVHTSDATKSGRVRQTIHHAINGLLDWEIPDGGFHSGKLYREITKKLHPRIHPKHQGEPLSQNEHSAAVSDLINAVNGTISGKKIGSTYQNIRPKSSTLEDFLKIPKPATKQSIEKAPKTLWSPTNRVNSEGDGTENVNTIERLASAYVHKISIAPSRPIVTEAVTAKPMNDEIAKPQQMNGAPYGGTVEEWVQWFNDMRQGDFRNVKKAMKRCDDEERR